MLLSQGSTNERQKVACCSPYHVVDSEAQRDYRKCNAEPCLVLKSIHTRVHHADSPQLLFFFSKNSSTLFVLSYLEIILSIEFVKASGFSIHYGYHTQSLC